MAGGIHTRQAAQVDLRTHMLQHHPCCPGGPRTPSPCCQPEGAHLVIVVGLQPTSLREDPHFSSVSVAHVSAKIKP